jgi:nucleoside phosphorylase
MRKAIDYKGKIDFAIISVREDEYAAVLARFPSQEMCSGNNRLYSISQIELSDHENYLVACAPSIEQGGGHAQDVARDIIEDLDPNMILLVGIAGAVPDIEFTLGDVVIAKRVHDFSVGAALEGHPLESLNQGGPMHKLVQSLLAQLPALKKILGDWNAPEKIGVERPTLDPKRAVIYGDSEWAAKVAQALRAHFGAGVGRRSPIVTVRSIASGNVLMKDSGTLRNWLGRARELAAIEMELNGVYVAARRVDHEYPVLCVRGISDIVGLQRDPIWTRYACETAASCAHAFVRAQLLPPRLKRPSNAHDELEPDAASFERFCSALRDRRVGREDEWGGEIPGGSIIGSKIKLPKRFLGFGELIVLFVPQSAALSPPRLVDLSKLQSRGDLLDKIQSWNKSCDGLDGYRSNFYPFERRRRNVDGLLLWSSQEKQDDYAGYYIQFHSNGIVEAVDHRIMGQVLHSRVIPATAVERAIVTLSLLSSILIGSWHLKDACGSQFQ